MRHCTIYTAKIYPCIRVTDHAIIAEAFYGKIAELLPLATFAGAGDATVTDTPQTALGAANIADLAAYRSGMTQIFTIEKDGAAGAPRPPLQFNRLQLLCILMFVRC